MHQRQGVAHTTPRSLVSKARCGDGGAARHKGWVMARRRLLVLLAAGALASAGAVAGAQTGAAAKPKPPPATPDKVVIIVVDALSKEIVEKYDMQNVEALMADGVDTPRGYLGHTGSVTVVTHNVITSGMLPKNMGWTNEGYRDVDGVLGARGRPLHHQQLRLRPDGPAAGARGLPAPVGLPRRHRQGLHGQPEGVRRLRPRRPRVAQHLGHHVHQRPHLRRACATGCRPGVPAPPPYIVGACGSRYWVERDKGYDTLQFPAQLYPATDDRYVVGDEPDNQGGDIWATDAVLDIMANEEDAWSGIFVSLPGVDKAAHMWGGVNDPEDATPGYDPMTHMEFATATADAQVGRIMDALEDERRARQHVGRPHRRPRIGRRRGRALARRLRAGQRLRLLQLVLRRSRERRSSTTSRRRPCSRSSTRTTSGSPTATPRSTSG